MKQSMSNLFLHYAHLLSLESVIKMNNKLEVGTKIGRVGKSGNVTAAHLHLECRKDLIGGVNFYPWYKSKQFIKDHYLDPLEYLAKPGIHRPMEFNNFGYKFLDAIGNNSWHPGLDANRDYGNQDLGDPLWLCQRATPIYFGTNSGWGLHVIFEVDPTEMANPLIRRVNEALRAAGAIVDTKRSEYWQQRVLMGEKRDFIDLVNGIKWRMANRRFPHEDGR